jgi:hypothetical protein
VEYPHINVVNEDLSTKVKKTKLRKKTIHMTQQYYDENTVPNA